MVPPRQAEKRVAGQGEEDFIRMRMNWRREEGIALVITLLVMTILFVMGTAFLSISSTETLIAINERNRVQAFHLAEAGLERAIAELNANGAYGGTTGPQSLGFGTYETTVTNSGPVPGVVDPKQIVSMGYVPNNLVPNRAKAQVEVQVQRGSPFQFGLFGMNIFRLESSGTGVVVDSYDSSLGPYDPANPGFEGHIHSNGDIDVEDNSTVRGNAQAAGTITVGAGSTITGTRTEGVPSIGVATSISYPACTGGVGISPGGNYVYDPVGCSLIVIAGKTVTFDQGTHSFGKITVQSGAKIAVNGPVTLYLTDQFKAEKNAVINTSMIPGNLMIFSSYNGTDGNGTDAMMMASLALGEFGEFYAGIYAPNGEVEFNNGGWQIYGAIIAKEIDIEDKSGFHFDKALTQARSPAGKFRPTANTWREVFP
jgi:hypothetical protein